MNPLRGSLLCVFWLVGCQFDTAVPATTVVRCSDGLMCPGKLSCVPRLGVCVDRTTGDLDAPFLRAAQLGATILRRGATTSLSLTPSERLALPPQPRLVQAGTTRTAQLVAERDGQFTYDVTADDSAEEGPVTVLVDLLDLSGNEAPNITAGSLRFDFTPPAVTGFALVGPRSASDAGTLSVRLDENVSVRVALTEPVVDGAALEGRPTTCAGAPVVFEPSANRDGLLGFDRRAPSGTSGCSYQFVVAGLVDLAGNVAGEARLADFVYDVDGAPPRLTGLRISREAAPGSWVPADAFSRQAGFRRMGVGFDVDVGAAEVSAWLNGEALPGCGLSSCVADGGTLGCWCERDVSPTDAPGAAVVRVSARDHAGNSAANEAAVRFDFSPPQVRSMRMVSPRASTDGGAIDVRPAEALAVRLVVDEPVRDDATVVARPQACAGAAQPLALTSNVAGLLDFALAAPTGTNGCAYGVAAEALVDLVGNAASPTPALLAYVVDGESPAVTQLETVREADAGVWVPAATFSQQPGFSQLGVRFAIDDTAVSTEVRVNGAALPGCALSSCVRGAGLWRCFCSLAISGAEAEGPGGVLVTGTDSAGNTRSVAKPIAFDYTPPALLPGTTSVSLIAPAASPLAAVTRLGAGGTVRLNFALTEVAAALPVVTTPAPGALTFVRTAGSATAFVYQHVLDGGAHGQGARSIEIAAVDAVNNAAVLVVGSAFVVDTVAPAPVNTAADGGAVYLRNPWGTGVGNRDFSVVGPSGAAEPGAIVRVIDQAQLSGAAELGRAVVSSAGAFVADTGTADRAVVYLSAVDAAGNQSPAVDVKNVVWRATLGGKVRGSTFENPHTVEARGWFSTSLSQRDAVETTQYAVLALVDAGVAQQASANRSWTLIDVDTNPTPRRLHTTVYDSRRRVSLVFGGQANATGNWLSDLAEWNGVSWLRRTPLDPEGDGNPSALEPAAAAFDAVRSRVVLFGSPVNSGLPGQTWEWDGASWALATPVDPEGDGNPFAGGGCMTYDSLRQRVLLFTTDLLGVVGELWEWNGASWRRRSTGGPPARGGRCGFAFNSVSGLALLFGGYPASGASSDFWEWNNTTWTRRPGAALWTGDLNVSGLFDGTRSLFVLEGGGDVLAWNGTTVVDITGAVKPSAGESATFDSARGRIVMLSADYAFAGTPSRTYEFSVAGGWVNRTPAGVDPPARDEAVGVFDTTRNRTMLYGGFSWATTSPLSDTWEWTGASWVVRSVTAPTAQYSPALSWDRTRDRAVLFAGPTVGTQVNQTWEWDGGIWTNRTPASGNPPAAGYAGLAFDEARNRTVLFGGQTPTSVSLAQTWLWNGAAWTRALPATSPPPRDRMSIAYDAARQRVVVFGGFDDSTPLGDTWEWNGTTWADRTPASGPPPRALGAMAYDRARQRVVLFGGLDYFAPRYGDFWEWDGTNWTPVPVVDPEFDGSPSGRSGAALVFAENRNTLVLSGGSVGTATSQTWESDALDPYQPAAAAHFSFAASGAEANVAVSRVDVAWWAGGNGADRTVAAAPTTGAALYAWERGSFLPVGSTTSAPTTAPQRLQWTLTDPTRLSTLFAGARRELAVAVVGTGVNHVNRATLGFGYVEAVVTYRRP